MSNSSKEAENLLSILLKNTIYEGRTYAVGGYVRDEYLGLDPNDLDVVVDVENGSEKIVQFIFSQLGRDQVTTPVQMGNYPIWQITFWDNVEYRGKTYDVNGAVVEFNIPMKESFPDDSSRQRNTEVGTLEDDVRRRDFTTNMLYKNITSGEVMDFAGTSKSDIDNGILRVHPEESPDKIFSDDPLRMLRMIRFKCVNGWEIPEEMMEAVRRNAFRIDIVSRERIMEELRKIMLVGKLKDAVIFMDETDLLLRIFPEISELKNIQQDERHHPEGDVFSHTLLVLENAKPTVEAQMAALLHDVGKLDTQEIDEKGIHF
jgi:tRNA nucleotidyltransferase/poly(A) polymerase